MGVASAALDGVMLAPSALSLTSPAVQLRLRRSLGRVDVVVAGLGNKVRVVGTTKSGDLWSARLTGVDLGDRPFTPQKMVLPSSERLSVRLEPIESDLQLIVKGRLGERVPTPTIASEGDLLVVSFADLSGPEPLPRGRLDLRRPGRVAQEVMAPPMRPRAVAPPLGDMAIGTMVLQNRSYVNVSGPPVTLSLNKAPANQALMSLARLGGYGIVFVGDSDTSSTAGGDNDTSVTMAFVDQTYGRALNSVLLASGLQAKLDGQTLMVGGSVSGKTFGPQISKVYRLNQASASSAADYLASLGAQINKVTISGPSADTDGEEGGSSGSSGSGVLQPVATFTEVETYGASVGPLRGLTGTTDSRLGAVTLVGDSHLISVAEGFLKQIDLRKRQVAVKVQILTVSLENDKTINSSFSSRIGNTFIVSDNGNAHLNFGEYKPSSTSGVGVYSGDAGYLQPGVYETNTEVQRVKRFVGPWVVRQTPDGEDYINENGEKEYYRDPYAGLEEKEMIDEDGKRMYEKPNNNERYRQPNDSFYSYINAMIKSSNIKTLAQPTLLVQEGEEAEVETGQSVITGRNTIETSNGTTEYSFTRENAGLQLNLKVSKIDDNGFVTMELNPEISVPVGAGVEGNVPIYNISGRKMKSGNIRLRDRQTLILTGVLQESDRQQVQKWPLLGDLPLIGQLFRGSGSTRDKNELVIVVTPSILNDEIGGVHGYGYRPGTSASRELIQGGF